MREDTMLRTDEEVPERQADTKDLTSSSKFSASCVLTLQTLPPLSWATFKEEKYTWWPETNGFLASVVGPIVREYE